MAEHRTVDADVVGSTPISHPKRNPLEFQRVDCLIDQNLEEILL